MRRAQVLLPLVLLLCLCVSSCPAASESYISSFGSITYTSINILKGTVIGDTCWKWTNYGEWLKEWHLDLIRQSGANLVKMQMNIWAWDTNVWLPNLGISYRQRIQQIMGWCEARNLKVVLEAGAIGTKDEDDWEAQWQTKADFLMNKSSITQSSWIETCQEIAQLRPYAIGPFNEPPGGGDYYMPVTYSQVELFDAYWSFILRAVQAIHHVSPETICHVESCPFWDLQQIIDKPLPEPNVVYEIHPYQTDGAVQEITAALSRGDFDEAKRLYKRHIMERDSHPEIENVGLSVQNALDAGLKVFCGECGTNMFQTEWQQYMQIHYDLMKEYSIDFAQLQFDGRSATAGPNYYGLLNDNQTALNEVGLLWYQNMR